MTLEKKVDSSGQIDMPFPDFIGTQDEFQASAEGIADIEIAEVVWGTCSLAD